MPVTGEKRTWTTAEVAALARRTPPTVRRWVRAGVIKPISPALKGVFGPDALAALGLLRAVPADDDVVRQVREAFAALESKR